MIKEEEWNGEIDIILKELKPIVLSKNANALIATFLTLSSILSHQIDISYERYMEICVKCYVAKKKKRTRSNPHEMEGARHQSST